MAVQAFRDILIDKLSQFLKQSDALIEELESIMKKYLIKKYGEAEHKPAAAQASEGEAGGDSTTSSSDGATTDDQ